MQNLPVVFCLDRAGFVGEDGRTHQGLFDLSFLSHLPNLTILSPINEYDLKLALDYALSLNSPVAIRYTKEGARSEVELKEYSQDANLVVKEGTDVEVLAVGGRMLDLALEFAKASPRSVKVRAIRKVNSLDGDLQSLTAPMIITLEENAIKGGFGSLIRQFIKLPEGAKIVCLGAKDDFVKHGTVKEQFIDSDLTLENLLAITNI
jgi:1-deoxy-D-xylulose-5-phosphate synthase